jgi:hypothetical protein
LNTAHMRANAVTMAISAAVIVSAVVVGTGGAALVFATEVWPHEATPTAGQPLGWKYPWSCCSSQDCREAVDGEITEGPNGYLVTTTGETVAYLDKRVKDSPDGVFHICAHQAGIDAGQTICLFRPGKGF